IACKWVKLACRRHEEDLKRSKKDKSWPFYFDEHHASDVCRFAELLPHIEGRWETPTITLEPWQVFCLAVIFGWRRRADGGRRFSKVYWEVARKNAKSTIAAIVTLYCFCCEGEPAPYVLIGATTGAQALKVFHPARMMALKTEALREAFGLQVWAKSITEPGGGYVQTINSKGSTQDGHNPHLGVLDELHAHKDRALYDVIDSAFGARKNPLLWIITTAGFDTNGICYEQRQFVAKVLEGVLEADHYFGIIFTLDDDEVERATKGEFDPRVWVKANPNLGVSVELRNMEAAAKEARAQPGKLGEFLTKRLNVWTSAKRGHIDPIAWKRCGGPVDLEALRSVPCWGGLDLASVSDLTSLRLIWWVDGRLKTWGTRYLPEAAVEPRTSRNSVPYERWTRQEFLGRPYLTVTEGDVTDYAAVERDIRWALSTFQVQAIGYDPWNAQDLVNRLTADGAPMVEVRQGIPTLGGPMKELDRLYLGGLLDHGGDEVLAWCSSNVVARKDHNDNLAPSKKDSMEKIDDYVALLNAMAVGLSGAEAGGSSVYESRGLLVLG
ncbi:MAG TPA: terminase TerL endonuclease subunit, partial [Gemmatimonadales bacterium]|nr:terminase TerL endonuclease subunit [Gemmatimonadales bacterium]